MLGNGTYYFSTFRKMVSYFGTLFNDIHITREASDGTVEQIMRVPITYSNKDRLLARVDADPEITRKPAIVLPMMSFEMIGMQYDGSRKLVNIGKNVKKVNDDANKFYRQYNPVPYNFDFNLYVYVKNQEDANKIVEQILPFFTPDWTATVSLIPEMGDTRDIPVILTSVDPEDIYDGPFTDRRVQIWTLTFTMKGYLFGPIVKKPIVKISNTQFYVTLLANNYVANAVGNSDVVGRITVTPGLTNTGVATSNSSATIPYSQIFVDDDFGYVVDVTGEVIGIGE